MVDVGKIFDLFLDVLAGLIGVLKGVSFTVASFTVNPFYLAVAAIVIGMVINAYWGGARS